MSHHNLQFDEVLEKALDLADEGKSKEEILAMFPAHKLELEKILLTVSKLESQKNSIFPSKHLLSQTLAKMDVTKRTNDRYSSIEATGRASLIQKLNNQIHNIMQINWKIAAPALVAVLIVVFLVSKPTTPTTNNQPGTNQNTNGGNTNVPATAGNVDGAVDAMIAASASEQAMVDQESGDASLFSSDSQALSDFGQSYDPNGF